MEEEKIKIKCLECLLIKKVNKYLWNIGKIFKCSSCRHEGFMRVFK